MLSSVSQKNRMLPRKTLKQITLVQVELVAHDLASTHLDWGEPIPAFVTRFPHVLESCLQTPFQKFNQRSLYSGIVGKSAVLFYLMVKNHPFQNGNKRVAVMTLLYFLYINGKWLRANNEEVYEFARKVAKSNPADREKVMRDTRSFIRQNIINN